MKEIKLKNINGIKVIDGRVIPTPKKDIINKYCYKVLTTKAMQFSIIYPDYLKLIEINKEFDEEALTKEGDIVIKKSYPFDPCYIFKEDENLLVSSFSVVIRDLPSDVNVGYLLAYLDSERGFEEINKTLTDSKSKIIMSKNQLLELNVLLPDIKTQKEIGDKFLSNLKIVRKTSKCIKENLIMVDSLLKQKE